MRIRSDLRGYQRAAVKFVKEQRKCALLVDMGLGKTAISLTTIADLARDLDIGRVLVVGPQRVVKKVWTDEAKEWSHTKDLTFAKLFGPLKKRREELKKAADIYLITTDLIKWLHEEFEGKEFPFDAIFIDESSKYKHADAKRSKSMRVLSRAVNYLVLMTGTVAPNGLHDLWAQMYLIDHGARLGHTLKAFRNRYFYPNVNGDGYKPRGFAHEAIQKKLSDVCFTLKSEDYLELPERIDNAVEIDLNDEVLAAYKKFEKSFVLGMEEGDITAVSTGALMTKLLQCANGVVYDSEKNHRFFHSQKIDALEDIRDEANGDNILVAYNYKSDIAAIMKRFPEAVLLRNDMSVIDRWNEGRIPMLLAHPQSAGHGLNLQFGGGTIVWYGLTWNLENYLQFNKRIHRHGQTRSSVIIHHLIARKTIDEKVMAALKRKDKDQNMLLDSLKGYVKGLVAAA